MPEDTFGLRPLQADDKTKISSGDADFAPLSQFLKKDAKRFERESLSRTYVAIHESTGNIASYITLVCSEVKSDPQLMPDGGVNFRYPHFPAIKIARLLTDQKFRGRGLGEGLIDFAVGRAKEVICPTIGCRFIMVDSKQKSVTFYQKCGFTLIDTPENKALATPVLFIDLHKAAAMA
ncbi:GNAT family N-acetyltransferase [Asticcacaulis benevestitus]|uniref:N-acetyltransferase domain-containing protein n=1 Tax=Asticcacaulis benevestitus DSM 16100 = ATCC BAA-896 TaxID=1121022 RepID=V4R0R1_9CAUL|nr:GNAT family N-acetyltransferase [Asticcacaulis benevestitus]ESQ84993.1 hypothetical protein ABENE_19445 [Asticcacaulis benevestitus DSM 16100 = ATCC BAA-896]